MPNRQLTAHAYQKAADLGLSSGDAVRAIQHAVKLNFTNDPKRGIPVVDAYLERLSSGRG